MKLTALIVDDSRTLRTLVKKLLRESQLADFDFVEAENGWEALEKFDPARTDIVFLDWNMPGMNGLQLVERLRGTDGAAGIPLVMVTVETAIGKVMQALDRYELDAYVFKPFTADDLRHRLTPLFDLMARSRRHRSDGLLQRLLSWTRADIAS